MITNERLKLIAETTWMPTGYNEASEMAKELLDRRAKDAAKVEPEKRLARYQPCGCRLCICHDSFRCNGCGAKYCTSPDCVFKTGKFVYENEAKRPVEPVVKGIERLPTLPEITCGADITDALVDNRNKINEIIDAVNELKGVK